MVRSPASRGRRPRLSMNADTLALACASSPAMNTSSGPPAARTWRKMVLNAFTTLALEGAASATICAMEVSSGMASPVPLALKGLVMSTMILPASASPYSLTTGTALSNSTARITMSPAGAAPQVPAVAPSPSSLARAADLAASRPMTSTALPPLRARAPMALAMFPEPMMLMLLMMCCLPRSFALSRSSSRIRPSGWLRDDALLGKPVCVLNVTTARKPTHTDWSSLDLLSRLKAAHLSLMLRAAMRETIARDVTMRIVVLLAVLALACLGRSGEARAQELAPRAAWVVDGPVNATAPGPAGSVYIGGRFGAGGPVTGGLAALDGATGANDPGWPLFDGGGSTGGAD